MARQKIFYKGRRKRRNVAIVPFVIALLIVAVLLVTFYGLQKYAVVTKDGVSIELPLLASESGGTDGAGEELREYQTVDASIVFDDADYSSVEATAGENLSGVRAIFVPYEDINSEKLTEYAGRISRGNALLLEMKPRSGYLMWPSEADIAVSYGIPVADQTTPIQELIDTLKEQDLYLVAQISCCIDEALAMRMPSVCLYGPTGLTYSDDTGTWLDAYNLDLREYIAQLVQELYDMGFDEVVLADVAHPTLPEQETEEGETAQKQIYYSVEMSTTQSPVNEICGFAVYVAQLLEDREGVLSIYCDSRTSLSQADTSNGQDAGLFLKVFDRVYYKTDSYQYTYNMQEVQPRLQIGSVNDRLVPVVENYIPSDNSSWILIDVDEE